MKKTYIILTIISLVIIFTVIAIIGNRLVNRNIENSVNDIAEIEETLKEISSSDSDYIDEEYSDFGTSLNEEATSNSVSEVEKQSIINDINDALSGTDTTNYDENAGLNIDFGNL
jgi:peptidoglycan hydrolase CwlO-like protein